MSRSICPFDKSSGWSKTPLPDNDVAFIVLLNKAAVRNQNRGGSLSHVNLNTIQFYCPTTEVTIQHTTDVGASKSLSGDMIINAFGHNPVSVRIKGAQLWLPKGATGGSDASVMAFFDRNNVYTNPRARITLGVQPGKNAPVTTYQCVLLAMESSITSEAYFTYTMSLLGLPTSAIKNR